MLADLEPDEIEQIMRPGDSAQPTAAVLSAAIITRLRELAADGPAVVELDGRPVLIELDGPFVIAHPLDAGSDG